MGLTKSSHEGHSGQYLWMWLPFLMTSGSFRRPPLSVSRHTQAQQRYFLRAFGLAGD